MLYWPRQLLVGIRRQTCMSARAGPVRHYRRLGPVRRGTFVSRSTCTLARIVHVFILHGMGMIGRLLSEGLLGDLAERSRRVERHFACVESVDLGLEAAAVELKLRALLGSRCLGEQLCCLSQHVFRCLLGMHHHAALRMSVVPTVWAALRRPILRLSRRLSMHLRCADAI